MFYEWKIPNANTYECPPSAACVLIVVSVTSLKKTKFKLKYQLYQNKNNEPSDSDTDNGVNEPGNKRNTTYEEGESF